MGHNRLVKWAKRQTWAGWTDKWLHRITIPAMLAVALYMALDVRPPPIKAPGPHPTVSETLLHSRVVVLAVWIIVVNGAIFLFASLIARTAAKQWARKAGPVESGGDPAESTKESISALEKAWAADALDAREEIGRLRERLRATEQALEDALADPSENHP